MLSTVMVGAQQAVTAQAGHHRSPWWPAVQPEQIWVPAGSPWGKRCPLFSGQLGLVSLTFLALHVWECRKQDRGGRAEALAALESRE